MKNTLIKLHWLLSSQFGFDPIRFMYSIRGIPLFLRDWIRFRRGYTGNLTFMPCLHDRFEEGGTTQSEYFWQDLLVARQIHAARPQKHVDVGSRVDNFVAHVASFRDVEVFDVRPISAKIPGIVFKQADLMQPVQMDSGSDDGYCDSLSCLHAIEHFGLGRYNDPVDSKGHERGIANMAKLIRPGGRFYLSAPIGQERVEFNANRVFDPRTIIRCATSSELQLVELTVIGAGGGASQVPLDPDTLGGLAKSRYNLGIFVFIKKVNEKGGRVHREEHR